MRCFVTGATGFIGTRLVRQLREAGHEVGAIARDPGKAGDLTKLGVWVQKGDITDKESLRGPMNGADGVFHLAAWYKIGEKDRSPGVRSNIEGTRNVLELMKELRIPKGVYTSTLAVFGDTKGQLVDESYRHDGPWLSEYDRTKWVAHYEVAEPMMKKGLPLVIVQPGVTYGPGDPSAMGITLREYLERKLRGVPKVSAYCWGHVEDTAAAHLLAMERGRAVDRIAVTIGDIEEAVPVVQRVARRTPTVPLEGPGGEVWLKLENLQRLGVFKIRGAWNRISRLTREERRRGVTTLSSGNHGRAVAWSARRLGLRCVIRVPEGAASQKLAAIRAEGAEVIPIPRSELIKVHEKETWRAGPRMDLPPFAHPPMIPGNRPPGLGITESVPLP